MAQYADPFYTNLRTFLNQSRATTGKRPSVNEAYGMTAGTMEPAYQAQQATAERALKREQFGVGAGQQETKLALEREAQGTQKEQFGQTLAFNKEQAEKKRLIDEEVLRLKGIEQESTGRLQEAQRRETEERIKMAPWVTAGSLLGGIGTTLLAAKSLGAFSFLSGMFGDTLPTANVADQSYIPNVDDYNIPTYSTYGQRTWEPALSPTDVG